MNVHPDGQQVLQIKMIHESDIKRFKMQTCYIDELIQTTKALQWIQPLPNTFQFYYYDEGVLCTVDDQDSLNEAIQSNLQDQKSAALKLILAQTH